MSIDLKLIEELVKSGESAILEFKKSTSQLSDGFKGLCALLNGNGGHVIFGVEPNGALVGQEVSDDTQKKIASELNKLSRADDVETHIVDFKDKRKFIVFHACPDSSNRPYFYDGRAFTKVQSTKRLMPDDQIRYLCALNNNSLKWEDAPVYNASIDDLDKKLIIQTVEDGIRFGRIPENHQSDDPIQILKHFKMWVDDRPTRAAIVVFANEPEYWFSQCRLRLARFRGLDKSEFIDSKMIEGNIFKLLEEGMAFVRRYVSVSGKFRPESNERIEEVEYPILAMREAFANALAHRDYVFHGSSVSIGVYDDRIEIWNYGALPEKLKVENLGSSCESYPQNANILKVLYYRKISESWGRGFNFIYEECEANHNKKPVFIDDRGFRAIFYSKFYEADVEQSTVETEVTVEDLSLLQQELLKLVSNAPSGISLKQIMEQLTIKKSERTVQENLTALKQKHLIQLHGRGRHAVWQAVDKK